MAMKLTSAESDEAPSKRKRRSSAEPAGAKAPSKRRKQSQRAPLSKEHITDSDTEMGNVDQSAITSK